MPCLSLRSGSSDRNNPFRLTAGLRRYDDLRTAAGDVGQVAIGVDGSTVEPGLRCPGEVGRNRIGAARGVNGSAPRSESGDGAWRSALGDWHAATGQALGASCDADWHRADWRAR